MKKIVSLVLAGIMTISSIPCALAASVQDYEQGTLVEFVAENNENYTITVPAVLVPGQTGGSVTLAGQWADNRVVIVTADETVTLVNSINSANTKVLNIEFNGISKAGNNKAPQSFTEPIDVADIENALFGTWSGVFEYQAEIVDNESPIEKCPDGCYDDDGDHYCDECDHQVSNCTDDNDGYCSICDRHFNCYDENSDHWCDECGDWLSGCEDEDNDEYCDICDEHMNCYDSNDDHWCEICEMRVSPCEDEDGDCECDICGESVDGDGEEEECEECCDEDMNHWCDNCDSWVDSCEDLDGDSYCEYCKEHVECKDANNNDYCDICGGHVNCYDSDGDHMCDICDRRASYCEDEDGDEYCNICGTYVGEDECEECYDDDGDQYCDICDTWIDS